MFSTAGGAQRDDVENGGEDGLVLGGQLDPQHLGQESPQPQRDLLRLPRLSPRRGDPVETDIFVGVLLSRPPLRRGRCRSGRALLVPKFGGSLSGLVEGVVNAGSAGVGLGLPDEALFARRI